jgi:hypothetical protein
MRLRGGPSLGFAGPLWRRSNPPRTRAIVAVGVAVKGFVLAIFVAASGCLLWPLLLCGGSCVFDFGASFAPDPLAGHLAAPDTRLNLWILWWVQHALSTAPERLFDANVFWPAPSALVGSEHMLSLAAATWPLRVLTHDAVAVYSAALWLTFVVTGASTYALVAWATEDRMAGLLAGVVALLMPWRVTELVHVQLLTAGSLPLVWWLAARTLLDDATSRSAAALTAGWLVALFSSYYVAFFALFSTAAFVVVVAAAERARVRRLFAVAIATVLPVIVLCLFSLPYLHAQRSEAVAIKGEIVRSLSPSLVVAELAPDLTLGVARGLWARGYELPISVVVLAALGLLISARRSVAAGLLAAIVVALVMSFGEALRLGGFEVPLPAAWASAVLPGFANLRGPLRWTIVVGVAAPALAGMGLAAIRGFSWIRKLRLVTLATAGVALALALDLRPPVLETAPAYAARSVERSGLGVLRDFEYGPVLDVPWPQNLTNNAIVSSEYMVASTVHRKPILAGYTAYTPRHYEFLVRAARGLPNARSVAQLRRMTGLRWIVLHETKLSEGERAAWEHAANDVPLLLAHRDESLTIYEVPPSREARVAPEALFASEPGQSTLLGVSRAPLTLRAGSAAFYAAIPDVLPGYGGDWMKAGIGIRIENRTDRAWPGLDPRREGLVAVRYRLLDAEGRALLDGVADLDGDVLPSGALASYVVVEGHAPPGAYRLELSLVQQLGATLVPLPTPPVVQDVRIERAG